MPTLTFLGSADSQGVPRWWCGYSVCQEARTSGMNARTRSSALLETPTERVLLDAAPELRLQMTRIDAQKGDGLLITHAHNDHVLGLVAAERLAAANSLNALNNNLARLVGPALGGLLIATEGFAGVVLASALTHAAAAALILGVRVQEVARAPSAETSILCTSAL